MSLPSSMADLVPCDLLLQKVYLKEHLHDNPSHSLEGVYIVLEEC